MAVLLYIVALPYLFFLLRKTKYKKSIPSRFFLKDNPSFESHGIWFHACSFGEVRSLKPFLEKIDLSQLRLSVMTQTGYHEATSYGNNQVRYLPFEIFLPFWMKQQKILIVMEAELWPLLFIVAKAKGIRTVLLNARLSDHSYRSYQRFAWLYRWIFSHVDHVFAQSTIDQERLLSIGAKNVDVCGNIKIFNRYTVSKQFTKDPIRRLFVLASTHESEEALILKQLTLKDHDQVIVVPRHPERFDVVHALLREYVATHGYSYARLSQDDSLNAKVILGDTMGDLINLYAIADIVILGGSFVGGIGGHNPLEPAYFGVKLISGRFIFNQKVLFESVENAVICDLEDLKNVLEHSDGLLNSRITHGGDVTPLLDKILGNNNGKSI